MASHYLAWFCCFWQPGVDLILEPADLDLAYQGVLDAVMDGRLSQERIDESLRRILRAKLELPQ